MDLYIFDINVFNIITTLIVANIVSFILAFPIIGALYKFKIVRHIDVDFSALIESRKDKVGTPIMGGLIFVLPIIVFTLFLNFNSQTDIPILIFAVMALLGGIDDVLNIYGKARRMRTLSRVRKLIMVHKSKLVRFKYILAFPWYVYARLIHIFESNPGKGLFGHEKFLIQIILGTVLGYWVYSTGTGSELWIPLLGSINIGILVIPFSIAAVLGMTNAVNFTDGLDGLSAGIAFISLCGFLLISILENNSEIALLTSTSIGALVTYLYFNIPPARVQMGDIGSFSLGSLLTVIAFSLGKPLLLLIMGLPYVVEFMSVIVQSIYRRIFGRRLISMAPLHHHLEMIGWSEEKVVMRFWLFTIISVIFGIWMYFI